MEQTKKTRTFWEKLDNECKSKDISTRMLCKMAGVSYATIVKQHGEDRLPTANQLLLFSRILGTSIDYLLIDICPEVGNANTLGPATLSQLIQKVYMLPASDRDSLNRMLK